VRSLETFSRARRLTATIFPLTLPIRYAYYLFIRPVNCTTVSRIKSYRQFFRYMQSRNELRSLSSLDEGCDGENRSVFKNSEINILQSYNCAQITRLSTLLSIIIAFTLRIDIMLGSPCKHLYSSNHIRHPTNNHLSWNLDR